MFSNPQLLPRSTRAIRNCTTDDARHLHLFFSYKEKEKAQAKEMCQTCECKAACYEVAKSNSETFGVWGGVDFSQSILNPPVVTPTRAPYTPVKTVWS